MVNKSYAQSVLQTNIFLNKLLKMSHSLFQKYFIRNFATNPFTMKGIENFKTLFVMDTGRETFVNFKYRTLNVENF